MTLLSPRPATGSQLASGDPSIRILSVAGEEAGTLARGGGGASGARRRRLCHVWALGTGRDRACNPALVAAGSLVAARRAMAAAAWIPGPPLWPAPDGPGPVPPVPGVWTGTAVHRVDLTGPDVGRDIEVGTHRAGSVISRSIPMAPASPRSTRAAGCGCGRLPGERCSAPSTRRLRRWARASTSTPPGHGWDGPRAPGPWCGASPIRRMLRLCSAGPRRDAVRCGGLRRRRQAGLPQGGTAGRCTCGRSPRRTRGFSKATPSQCDLAFTADSRFLATCGYDGALLWPISPEGGRQRLIDLGEEYFCHGMPLTRRARACWWQPT